MNLNFLYDAFYFESRFQFLKDLFQLLEHDERMNMFQYECARYHKNHNQKENIMSSLQKILKAVLVSAVVLPLSWNTPGASAESVQMHQTPAKIQFEAGDAGTVKPVDPENPGTENPNPDPGGTPDPAPSGPLALNYASPLDFGTHKVSATTETYKSTTKTPYIQVTDLRGTAAGWNVTVKASHFKDLATDLDTLQGATFNLTGGEVLSASNNTDAPTTSDLQIDTDGTEVTVLTAESGKGTGTWIERWKASGETNEKVTLTVPAAKASTGQHETTLTWTLSDTP